MNSVQKHYHEVATPLQKTEEKYDGKRIRTLMTKIEECKEENKDKNKRNNCPLMIGK